MAEEETEPKEEPTAEPAVTPKSWLPSRHDEDLDAIARRLGSSAKVIPWGPKQVEGYVEVPSTSILEVCRLLKDDAACKFDLLLCISGVDYSKDDPQLAVIYHLLSIPRNRRVQIRTWVPKSDPSLESVETLWPAANWHERETYDLVGILFRHHSDLRRILCPEDWVGHPLRKDYEFPKEYHGISCV